MRGDALHFGRAAKFRFKDEDKHPPRSSRSSGHLLNAHGIYPVSVSCFTERHLAYFLPRQLQGLDPPLELHTKEDNWLLHVNFCELHTNYIEPAE